MKRRYIIIVFPTIAVITLAAIVYIVLQKKPSNIEHPYGNDALVSTPISLPVGSIDNNAYPVASSQIILRRPSVDINNPFTEEALVFDLGTSLQTRDISSVNKLAYSEDFTLYFFAIPEGSGGIFESLPDNTKVNNKLNKTITRVMVTSENDNRGEYFKSQHFDFKNSYFYTSNFEKGCLPAPYGYCGSDSIDIYKKDDGDTVQVKIYCLTNNSADSVKCDKVIENMTFKLEKIVENKGLGYQFVYKDDLFVREAPVNADLKILGGHEISAVAKPSQGYQLPVIVIDVYDRAILNNMNLSDWAKSVSVDKFENMASGKKYISNERLSLNQGKIVFLINDNPVINGKTPVLIIDNGVNIYELTRAFQTDELYLDILNNFKVKFNDSYIGLTNEEIDLIHSFMNSST